jgi:uncharacterized membrane protein YfcA
MARNALFIALGIVTLGYLLVLARDLQKRAANGERVLSPWPIWVVSFVANFLDTLGIGSYATTTSMIRQWRLIPDERIPGSMNVGYVLPTVVEAYIYTTIVPVDPATLILMIAAAVIGAWLGAGVVSSWNRRKVQIGMGLCLLGFAVIKTLSQLSIGPAAGLALKLTGSKLALAIVGNMFLGALMTMGIGLYAPCMILIGLLGMNPTSAFPIMMGSCAFLMPMASIRFVRAGSFDVKSMVGMLIAGIPAVLIAAFIVKSLPLTWVKWLVVIVVTYASINLLRAGMASRAAAVEPAKATGA